MHGISYMLQQLHAEKGVAKELGLGRDRDEANIILAQQCYSRFNGPHTVAGLKGGLRGHRPVLLLYLCWSHANIIICLFALVLQCVGASKAPPRVYLA